MLLVKQAKELQKKGGNELLNALKTYNQSIEMIESILQTDISIEYREKLKVPLEFITNAREHLRVHLHAKTKFQPEAKQHYITADAMVNKALELDEHQQGHEAIKAYQNAIITFKKALEGIE